MPKKPSRLHLDKRAGKIANEARDDDQNQLLRTRELAKWLGVSVSWLEITRGKEFAPPFLRLAPRLIRYRRSDIIRWLEQRERMTQNAA